MDYCSECGEKLNENSSFCPNCGEKIEKPTKKSSRNIIIITSLIIIIIILVTGIAILSTGTNQTPSENVSSYAEPVNNDPEPDYESYHYSNSFEDTDRDGNGYVTLSDMNIAHTPQNIINQMYSDADMNGDGKLNRHEYYKFMYLLNYDYESYGLWEFTDITFKFIFNPYPNIINLMHIL